MRSTCSLGRCSKREFRLLVVEPVTQEQAEPGDRFHSGAVNDSGPQIVDDAIGVGTEDDTHRDPRVSAAHHGPEQIGDGVSIAEHPERIAAIDVNSDGVVIDTRANAVGQCGDVAEHRVGDALSEAAMEAVVELSIGQHGQVFEHAPAIDQTCSVGFDRVEEAGPDEVASDGRVECFGASERGEHSAVAEQVERRGGAGRQDVQHRILDRFDMHATPPST